MTETLRFWLTAHAMVFELKNRSLATFFEIEIVTPLHLIAVPFTVIAASESEKMNGASLTAPTPPG